LGLLTRKTVSHTIYTVLLETLNPAQSIMKSLCPQVFLAASDRLSTVWRQHPSGGGD